MAKIEWSTLTTQFGITTSNPSHKDCEAAIDSMKNDPEHSNIWLSIGYDDGTLCVLDYYPAGDLIYTRYSDQDMESEETAVKASSIKFGRIALSKCFFDMVHGNREDVESDIRKRSGEVR